MRTLLNGKFDFLHPGHFNLLVYARTLAGRSGTVIVALDTTKRIIQLTGRQPLFTEDEREKAILRLTYPCDGTQRRLIDAVDFFDSEQELRGLINIYKPLHLIKGEDWKDKEVIGSDLADVIFYKSYYEFHATDIEKRIIERHEHKVI